MILDLRFMNGPKYAPIMSDRDTTVETFRGICKMKQVYITGLTLWSAKWTGQRQVEGEDNSRAITGECDSQLIKTLSQ